MREMSQEELPRMVEIDASEVATIIYKYLDGKLVATPEEWYRPPWDTETWNEGTWTTVLGLEGIRICGSFEDDRLIGIAVLRPRLTQGVAQLAALFVSREYRRQGVAASLVGQA